MNRSVESLSHFQCESCDKWWSIGDAPLDKKSWYCPWCGHQNYEHEEQKTGPVPEWDHAKDFLKTLEDAAKEMEKLFGPFKDVFKKK